MSRSAGDSARMSAMLRPARCVTVPLWTTECWRLSLYLFGISALALAISRVSLKRLKNAGSPDTKVA